jgi:hypothetical protein
MGAQIVFLTLFLGLVSGKQQVAVDVSGPVKIIQLKLGDREVALMAEPPWRATVDFGPELTPRELTAIGYDEEGHELARAAQVLNLPRPTAEFEIMLDGNDASLHWRHLAHASPTSSTMTLDGKSLPLDKSLHARLPKIDRDVPHVLAAEMRFADGAVARRELVIESERSASVGTQLTPITLRETAPSHPATWDRCLARPDGTPARIAAVEKPRALMIMVRDPERGEITRALGNMSFAMRSSMALGGDSIERILWPMSRRIDERGDTSVLFDRTGDFSGTTAGVLYLMLSLVHSGKNNDKRREFADAVAVAGVQAMSTPMRRAVVLVLGSAPDASAHNPAAVRRYLQALGVPLFVWSVTGPRPELAASWGEVSDIATLPKLADAVSRVRHTLEEQRIAWVDVDPLMSLHLKADARCGIETMAR